MGIRVPYIVSAHEIFVNGIHIGGRGKISASGSPVVTNYRYNYYYISKHIINFDKHNRIALRIACNTLNCGFYFSEFDIGEANNCREAFYTFLIKKSVFAFIFLFFGIYHFFLFIRRRKDLQYLYFSGISISFGLIELGLNTIGYWFWDNSRFNFSMIHIGIIVAPFFYIEFFHKHFGYKNNYLIFFSRCYMIVMLVIYSAGVYLNNTIFFAKILRLYITYIFVVFVIAYCVFVNFRALRDKKAGALTIGIGFFFFSLTVIYDMLRTNVFLDTPSLLDFGFLFFILSIALAQAQKYNLIQNSTELLNIHLAKTNKAYARFVPDEFLKFLKHEDIVNVSLGDQVQKKMTVLFSDIRSFTELSEKMSPDDNFKFINSYLKRIGPLVRNNNGFIDKYIGDAVMALFPDKPGDAILAAVAMQQEVRLLNESRENKGFEPIRIGIGIHFGNLMLGTIGEEERMDSTVISDAVNQASRMEGLTKLFKSLIIVTKDVLEKTDEKTQYRNLGRVQVKGKKEAVEIFEILNADPEGERTLKLRTKREYESALNLYQNKDFTGAISLLKEIRMINPSDPVVNLFYERCDEFITSPPPDDWNSVEVMETK